MNDRQEEASTSQQKIATVLQALLTQTADLKVAKLTVETEVMRSGPLPNWLGSALRGAFGHAYKNVVCMVAHRECERCLLRQRCPYTYLFETWKPDKAIWMTKYDRVPHPFILHPPPQGAKVWQKGESLCFEMSLFGQAVELLPYLILSWEELASQGLGSERIPLKVLRVSRQALPSQTLIEIYTPGKDLSGTPQNWSVPISALRNSPEETQRPVITLHWQSPVRLSGAHPDQSPELPFHTLISSLLRRLSMLAYFHGDIQVELDFQSLTLAARQVQTLESQLYWQDLQRYSSRQKQAMNLGGLSGSVSYEASARDYLPLLQLGQWLHVGKNTSFGLGQYHLLSK